MCRCATAGVFDGFVVAGVYTRRADSWGDATGTEHLRQQAMDTPEWEGRREAEEVEIHGMVEKLGV